MAAADERGGGAGRRRRGFVLAAAGLTLAGATLGISRLVSVSAAPAPTASVTVPTEPYRILDTRNGAGTGGVKAPVGPGGSLTLQVAGVGPVPADATGIVINLTVSNGTASGSYITAWPTGTPRPDTSVINIVAGQDTANMVTATLGDGRLDLYNFIGNVDLIADVAGYLVPASSSGAVGPQGPMGLQGPPGPSAASGAATSDAISLSSTSYVTAAQLSAVGGLGALDVGFDARLAISGSVQIVETSGGGQFFADVECMLVVDAGTGPVPAGPSSRTTVGDYVRANYAASVSLDATIDADPGTYDVGIRCIVTSTNGRDSQIVMRSSSLNVVAVAR